MTSGAILLAAPTSGAGKTTITLGLLRALRNAGIPVRGAKSGPDYIDPRFHEAAAGQTCLNLDAWAMSPDRIRDLATGDGPLLIEGAMGLFDGAPPSGKGSSADIARILAVPVVLIVDASKTAQSVAPLVAGFAGFAPDVTIAGVILNRVGSARHEAMLRQALAPLGLPVLGAVHRSDALSRPSRHLGLVQAGEHPDLEAFLEIAAAEIGGAVNLNALLTLARPPCTSQAAPRLRPPAQRIAVAQDRAFAFAYPHMLADWRSAGAEITFFSPLNNEAAPASDFLFLPGGYPEIFAETLANADVFKASVRTAAQKGTQIYGECGGYMALGEGLIDAKGARHEMLGLLPVETSFETRKLHLGYRDLYADAGPFNGHFKAHEFHYATTLRAQGTPLFKATDAEGNALPPMGLLQANICGSFAHIIDKN
ncbi:cobyrinate a,c-diamide synthase [Falsihalocynthiibacter sp. BN13B15]|uniref:cobyrinate a,c-diamide synthase n=1 Tax=Falsihalocynthiibacter sp. BN13B15 TaxID=3240871 RepID=UPI00350F902E